MKKRDDKFKLRNFLKLITKREKFYLIFSLLFVVFSIAFRFYIPIIIGQYIDGFIKHQPFDYNRLVLLISIIFTTSVGSYIANIFLVLFSESYISNLRNTLFEKVNYCSISYIDRNYKGDVIGKITTDCEYISIGIQNGLTNYLEGITIIISTLIYMFTVNFIMAFCVIGLTSFSVFVTFLLDRFGKRFFRERVKNNGDLQAFSFETLNNYELERSYNLEKYSQNIFKEKSNNLKASSRKSMWIGSLVNPSTRIVNNIIFATVILLGVVLCVIPVAGLTFTIGNLASFIAYTNQYMKPFNEIASVNECISLASASLRRINDLLEVDIDKDIAENPADFEQNIENIEINNLDFGYSENHLTLKNINFKLNKGEKLAIVGTTGSGKTTIINLIMRFYNPQTGELDFNNISYRDLSKKSLRNKMTMVLQETWIFNGTILDNIRYGNEDISYEEVVKASKLTTADDFISRLADGYNTKISATSGLSIGEMQLICITRMLLNEADFIILDEATSNVDLRNEQKIYNGVNLLLKDKTSIVIAHRLSTIISADKIIVLDQGQIIEEGNHKSLMQKKGFYYNLYRSQFE